LGFLGEGTARSTGCVVEAATLSAALAAAWGGSAVDWVTGAGSAAAGTGSIRPMIVVATR
jgi:hypothetical protein